MVLTSCRSSPSSLGRHYLRVVDLFTGIDAVVAEADRRTALRFGDPPISDAVIHTM